MVQAAKIAEKRRHVVWRLEPRPLADGGLELT
jgi:hypothetical protein